MIKAKIVEIIDHGWTFEIHAEINGFPRAFFEVELTPEKLKMHIQHQWQIVEKAKALSEPYRKNCQEWAGVEFEVMRLQKETSSSGQTL